MTMTDTHQIITPAVKRQKALIVGARKEKRLTADERVQLQRYQAALAAKYGKETRTYLKITDGCPSAINAE
jgi:hypothetical protein